MFHRYIPTSTLTLRWIRTQRYLVRLKDPQLIHELSPSTYKSRYKKEIKQRYKDKDSTVHTTEQEMSQTRDECPQRNWSSIRHICGKIAII